MDVLPPVSEKPALNLAFPYDDLEDWRASYPLGIFAE